MTKNNLNRLVCFLLLVVLVSCNNDDQPQSDDILLSYSMGDEELEGDERFLIIITDEEGNLVDSAELKNGQSRVFMNEKRLKRYTLSEISYTNFSSILIRTFANTTVSQFRRDGNLVFDEVGGTVSFTIGNLSTPGDLNGTIRSSSSLISSNNQPVFPPQSTIEFGVRNPSLYLTYEQDNQTPSFQLIKGLQNGQSISLNLDDFKPLSPFTVLNDAENVQYRSNGIGLWGLSTEFGFVNIPVNSFAGFSDFSNGDPVIYYPQEAFDDFHLFAQYQVEDQFVTVNTFGALPASIEVPGISGEVVQLTIDHQEINTTGDVNRIFSAWQESKVIDGEQFTINWLQYWPADLSIFTTPVVVYEIVTGSSDLSEMNILFNGITRYSEVSDYDGFVGLLADPNKHFISSIGSSYEVRLR